MEERLSRLIAAIETGFEGLGRPESIDVSVAGLPGHEEFLIRETRYRLIYHTFRSSRDTTPEKMRAGEIARLRLLRRKFLEDLTKAEKLLVWKSNTAPPEYEVIRLATALRRYGPNTLLWVRQATPAIRRQPCVSSRTG